MLRIQNKIKSLSKAQSFTKFLEEAPYVIVALVDPSKSNHWLEDMGACLMLLLLEAHSLGLGACWGAIYKPEKMEREKFVKSIIEIPS
ncbi:MAG: nitroreductase family protein [Thermodesulfovibrio sp.]|nr:nitroreductase family protein [Thermodesulfovibrio sp.]